MNLVFYHKKVTFRPRGKLSLTFDMMIMVSKESRGKGRLLVRLLVDLRRLVLILYSAKKRYPKSSMKT